MERLKHIFKGWVGPRSDSRIAQRGWVGWEGSRHRGSWGVGRTVWKSCGKGAVFFWEAAFYLCMAPRTGAALDFWVPSAHSFFCFSSFWSTLRRVWMVWSRFIIKICLFCSLMFGSFKTYPSGTPKRGRCSFAEYFGQSVCKGDAVC